MNSVGAMIGTLLPLKNGLPIFFTKQSLIGRLTRECVHRRTPSQLPGTQNLCLKNPSANRSRIYTTGDV